MAASELLKVKTYKENIVYKDAIIEKQGCQAGLGGRREREVYPKSVSQS